ncbi:hypothetical protein Hrd1104_03535 [Halorhabdus sp. CBA1104]|nr:hypothetical protein Hrd1104_03535 [Halorhabdus sp. CBA1104]
MIACLTIPETTATRQTVGATNRRVGRRTPTIGTNSTVDTGSNPSRVGTVRGNPANSPVETGPRTNRRVISPRANPHRVVTARASQTRVGNRRVRVASHKALGNRRAGRLRPNPSRAGTHGTSHRADDNHSKAANRARVVSHRAGDNPSKVGNHNVAASRVANRARIRPRANHEGNPSKGNEGHRQGVAASPGDRPRVGAGPGFPVAFSGRP